MRKDGNSVDPKNPEIWLYIIGDNNITTRGLRRIMTAMSGKEGSEVDAGTSDKQMEEATWMAKEKKDEEQLQVNSPFHVELLEPSCTVHNQG